MHYNQTLSGSIAPKDSKDAIQALKMDFLPCKGGLTNHSATKYLAVSNFHILTTHYFTN